MAMSPAIRNLTSDFYFLQYVISKTQLKIPMENNSRNSQSQILIPKPKSYISSETNVEPQNIF